MSGGNAGRASMKELLRRSRLTFSNSTEAPHFERLLDSRQLGQRGGHALRDIFKCQGDSDNVESQRPPPRDITTRLCLDHLDNIATRLSAG